MALATPLVACYKAVIHFIVTVFIAKQTLSLSLATSKESCVIQEYSTISTKEQNN